jgi:hypothetical protein
LRRRDEWRWETTRNATLSFSRLEAAHKKDKRKICRQVKWIIFSEWLHKKLWFMSVSDSQLRMMTKLLFLIVSFNFFCCYYCSPHKYFFSQYKWVFTPLHYKGWKLIYTHIKSEKILKISHRLDIISISRWTESLFWEETIWSKWPLWSLSECRKLK